MLQCIGAVHLLVHCEYTHRYGYLPSMDRRGTDAALAVALVMLWSSGFVGARLGTEAATATTLLAWRFLCAAAVLGWSRPSAARGSRGVTSGGTPCSVC